ncbi:YceI family protein [Isoalcanivorax beigongshangi]|uniref:YceI family protein n=1 Tax=Isoalcanivorax beigongshangi TaxID=3238810 RepID=A0ABV4AJC1_9GAMM
MRHAIALAALISLSGASFADTITDYTLDPTHAQVRFSWSHLGFSTPGANFDQVTGTVRVNEEHPERSTVSVRIPVDSVNTHVPLLDEHLLTQPGFFDAKAHPDITFESTGIRNVDRDQQRFDLVGTLTVNGIQKEVVLATQVNKVGPHPMWDNAPAIGLDARTTVKRSDFKMDAYAPAVSDEMPIQITIEAVEAKAFAEQMAKMAK